MQSSFKLSFTPEILEQFYALEASLFSPSRKKHQGAACYYNINAINQMFWFIKDHCFTAQEQMNLNDHQVQVYLIELYQMKRRNINLERLIEDIVTHIHEHSRFWNDYSQQHMELKKVESINDGCCASKEAILITYRILEEIINDSFGVKTNQNPFECYKDYLSNFQNTHKASKGISEVAPDVQFGIAAIEAFLTTDQYTTQKEKSIDNLLKMVNQKSLHVNINGLMVPERRFTRRENKCFNAEDIRIYERFLDERNQIETEYKVDLSDYEKVNYSVSARLNVQNYNVPKIDLKLLRLIYLYTLGKIESKPKMVQQLSENCKKEISVSAWEVFSYRIQNFIMFLGINKYQIGEMYYGRKFDHQEFYEKHILSAQLDETGIIKSFFKFAHKNSYELHTLKDNPSNPEKFIFLRNLLLLAELFTKLGIKRSKGCWIQRVVEADLAMKTTLSVGKIQESLEKQLNFPLKIQRQIVVNYILHRENINENYGFLRNYLSYHLHNNSLAVGEACEAYIQHGEGEETKKKKSYRFFDSSSFNWSTDQFKNFLIGFKTYFNNVINNRKISKLMGQNTQPNHVKYIKGLYTRRYSKEAKKRKITLEQIVDEHIQSFDFAIFDFLKPSLANKRIKVK